MYDLTTEVVERSNELEKFHSGEFRIETGGLRQQPGGCLDCIPLGVDIKTTDRGYSITWLKEARQDSHRSCLPCPIWSQKTKGATLSNLQIQRF